MNRCMEGRRCMFFTQQLYFTLAPSAAATAEGEAREFANSGTKRAMGRINIAERASVHESRRRNAQHGTGAASVFSRFGKGCVNGNEIPATRSLNLIR